MCVHTCEDPEIYQIWICVVWFVNHINQNNWPKETWKKYPIEVIQTAVRAWLSDSLSLSLSPPMGLSICTVLFSPLDKYLLHYFFLCGNSLLWSWRPDPSSLTMGLVARIWCFHPRDQPQSRAGNPSLASSHCRPRPPEIRAITNSSKFLKGVKD